MTDPVGTLMAELRTAGLNVVGRSLMGGVLVKHALTDERLVPFRQHKMLPCDDPQATIIYPKEGEQNVGS